MNTAGVKSEHRDGLGSHQQPRRCPMLSFSLPPCQGPQQIRVCVSFFGTLLHLPRPDAHRNTQHCLHPYQPVTGIATLSPVVLLKCEGAFSRLPFYVFNLPLPHSSHSINCLLHAVIFIKFIFYGQHCTRKKAYEGTHGA